MIVILEENARSCARNSPGSTVTVPDAGEGAGAVLAINLVVSTPISPTSLLCLECNSIPL